MRNFSLAPPPDIGTSRPLFPRPWMPPPPTLARLCRVRDLLRDQLAQPLTLADCAEDVDLSPGHLHRAFRAAFGETPHAFLTRMRIDRARRLLATPAGPSPRSASTSGSP